MQRICSDDKRIKIFGKKDRPEINDMFADTDLTIVPSLVYENSPAVVYESLGAGVPVLAARIGGV
ncbi:glycosyltransferase family 4 protein, partial [Candidatus Saccharibacteria bacterium]|nr:glycosyltransferase family 4 protein [Candidatus Saccharibacteria bacterium]